MTTLDRKLADTFRAARWDASAGAPACPGCYDGHDLADPAPLAEFPGLYQYHCHACHKRFSDISDTPLRRRRQPLLWWAHAALDGDVQAVTPKPIATWQVRALLRNSPTMTRWAEQLHALGIDAQPLRQRLEQQLAQAGAQPARQPKAIKQAGGPRSQGGRR